MAFSETEDSSLGIKRKRFAVWLLLWAGAGNGCTLIHHERYVGTVLDEGRYVNRGFGLVVELAPFLDRWRVSPQSKPEPGGIDLNGDGVVSLDESVLLPAPLLALQARTSTARLHMTVDVVSEPAASSANLEGLFRGELKTRAPKLVEPSYARRENLTSSLGRRALLTRLGPGHWLALLDQTVMEAEFDRRQVVRYELWGGGSKEAEDLRQLVRSTVAARETSEPTRSERW